MKKVLGAAMAACAMLWAGAASAAVFATLGYSGDTPNVSWAKNADETGGTFSGIGSSNITVSLFLAGMPLNGGGVGSGSYLNLPATMTINAVSSGPAVIYSVFSSARHKVAGTLGFTYAGSEPLVVDGVSYTFGANLFSATFDDAVFTSFGWDETPGVRFQLSAYEKGAIEYSSDIINFSWMAGNYGEMIMGNGSPTGVAGETIESFQGVVGRDFTFFRSVVPEPATWAMMIVGFGMVGAGLRHRRTASGVRSQPATLDQTIS